MPLYLSSLTVNKQVHNVVFAASEHDSVYAFDADSGSQLWKISTLGSGETPSDDHGCSQISPEIGITSTPVVDRKAGTNGILYVVAMSKDSGGKYHQRLHALDATTGAESLGGPAEITATFPTSAGTATLDPGQYAERSALLLLNGVIYTGWTSHCDHEPYQGWAIGYSASTLKQSSILNLTPNGTEGSIRMSSAGMAADSAGYVYFLDANGAFDATLDSSGFPTNKDLGNAFLELSTSPGLAVADYFATHDTVQQSAADSDLGSGGALVLPDQADASAQARQLVVGAGKDGNIYLLDRHNMGKFNSSGNKIYQQLSNALGGSIFGAPAYFNGILYFGAAGRTLKAFPLRSAKLATLLIAELSAFHLPRNNPWHLGPGNCQWNCLGSRERQYRRVTCIRRHGPIEGTLQQHAGRVPRQLRRGQQVHNPDDRRRQGVCGNSERRSCVRAVAIKN